jgi:hypothetical protein
MRITTIPLILLAALLIAAGPTRDLSRPSTRLVGHWEDEHRGGAECYYGPVDPSTRVGSYVLVDTDGRTGHNYYKIVAENIRENKLTIELRTEKGSTDAKDHVYVDLEIAPDGYRMDRRLVIKGLPLSDRVYYYVDSKTSP